MIGFTFFILFSIVNNCDLTHRSSIQKLDSKLNVVSGILICRPSESIPQEGIFIPCNKTFSNNTEMLAFMDGYTSDVYILYLQYLIRSRPDQIHEFLEAYKNKSLKTNNNNFVFFVEVFFDNSDEMKLLFENSSNHDDYREPFLFSMGNINREFTAQLLPYKFGLMDHIKFLTLQEVD